MGTFSLFSCGINFMLSLSLVVKEREGNPPTSPKLPKNRKNTIKGKIQYNYKIITLTTIIH